jgi:hypothetical protein
MGEKKFNGDRRATFLREYQETGLFNASARKAGVCAPTIRTARKEDAEFSAACDEALQNYREAIETEIKRRAIDGWLEPIYQKGEQVGEVRRYSDRMLELHAKRHIPEYRDKQSVDLSVHGGVLVVPKASLTAEQWERENNGEKKSE